MKKCQSVVWCTNRSASTSQSEHLRSAWDISLIFFCFSSPIIGLSLPFMRMAATVTITLVPKNDFAHGWSQYKIFDEKLSLDSWLSISLRHPNHILGLLLIGIADIRPLHFFHASVLVDNDFENINTLSHRQRLLLNSLTFLFNIEKGIRCNPQVGLWSSWAEIKIWLYFQLSVASKFVRHSWQNFST